MDRWILWRLRRRVTGEAPARHHVRDRLPRPGDLFKLYVVGYCSLRFLVDFTRADPHVLPGLTLVQVLYVPTIAWFGYKLWSSYRLSRRVGRSLEQRAIEVV